MTKRKALFKLVLMSHKKLRISVSISKEVIGRLDQKIDRVRIRNRSHAIECLLSQYLGLSNVNQAVILIGGKDSSRMITAAEAALKEISESSISSVMVISGSMASEVEDKLTIKRPKNIYLNFTKSSEGTGGGLRDNKRPILSGGTFLLVNTSKWPKGIDLNKFFLFHGEKGRVATIYKTDDNMQGLYVFEPEIFRYIPKSGFSMLERDVFPYLFENDLAINYFK